MNWDDLRVFMAVAEHGTLSAAARTLKLSQPTVGRRLAAFEARVGTRLFDRLPEGLMPTAEGSALLPHAREMARAAEAAERQKAAFAEAGRGEVRISATEVTAGFLAARLARLRASLPGIDIELAVTHVAANLSRREADLAIRVCQPDYGALISRKLGDLGFAIYAARSYLRDRGPLNSDLETLLRDQDWVTWDEEHQYMPGAEWLTQRRGARPAPLRITNVLAKVMAVRQGAGLALLSCPAGDAEPDLVRLTPPIAELVTPLFLIVHPQLRRSPQVRATMDALITLYREDRAALAGDSVPRAAAE